MFRRLFATEIKNFNLLKNIELTKSNVRNYSIRNYRRVEEHKERFALPSRPINWKNEELTKVVQSRDEFKFVEKILPSAIVPEPQVHESYPTPSGWMPPNYEKSSKLPYYVLRSRFHNFPIYVLEREGGSRKLVRIKNIHGNIWQFDSDLRKFIQESLEKYEGKKMNIYSQVNEVQRQVLIKGHHHEYISKFFIECGF